MDSRCLQFCPRCKGATMSNPITLVDRDGAPINLHHLAERIYHVANVLDVLSRALPEDRRGEVPAKCLSEKLAEMAQAVAIEVSEARLGEVAQ